ncbi:MAG TPA: hypothetical protein VFX05_13740, partial [Casimicrobiaceae bacterium]|nr:hypothetical protein [Casimicrobiaceae bacterium]
MKFISTAFRMLAAFAIASVALPGAAQNIKYFTLAAPATLAVTTTTVNVSFTNVENGNSSFNAVSVEALPSNGTTVTITGATAAPGGPGTPVVLASNKIALVGLAPTKKGQTLTVTLTVQISGTACGGGYVDWKGDAWTGSPSSPSTPFVQQNANPRSTLGTSCTFSIESITPATMAKGTSTSGVVRVRNASSSTSNITAVTLTPPSGITTPSTTYGSLNIVPGSFADVAVAPSALCDAGGSGGAWTASSSGFTLTGTVPSTSVTGSCKLAFSGLPSSVVVGQQYTIKVDLLDGGSNKITGFGGSVNLLLSGSGCQLQAT